MMLSLTFLVFLRLLPISVSLSLTGLCFFIRLLFSILFICFLPFWALLPLALARLSLPSLLGGVINTLIELPLPPLRGWGVSALVLRSVPSFGAVRLSCL